MAMHLFSPGPLDDIVKEHLFDDWDRYSGMNIFVEEWVDQTTYATAADLINSFGLQSALGFQDETITPDIVEDRYPEVSTTFQDIRTAMDETSVRQLNKDSEVASVGGPEYVTGQDGLRFGLTFEASWDDLQDLREEFPRNGEEREASFLRRAKHDELRCQRRAIEALKQVDFGFLSGAAQADSSALFRYAPMPGLDMLHQAQEALQDCGLYSDEIALAIRSYRTKRDRAEELIHGPSGMGSNKGALNDLIESVARTEMGRRTMSQAPKYVRYAGAIYERADEQQEARTAYNLPKKMKGVKPCTPKDQTDEKPKGEQVWCVFDWKNNLRGRFKVRTKALRHKVFMINRGKGGKGGGGK
jgi:hypothetical protein